jgi:hypothetical protein
VIEEGEGGVDGLGMRRDGPASVSSSTSNSDGSMILLDPVGEAAFESHAGGADLSPISGIRSIILVPPPDQIPPSRFERGEPNIRLGEKPEASPPGPSSIPRFPPSPVDPSNPKPEGLT